MDHPPPHDDDDGDLAATSAYEPGLEAPISDEVEDDESAGPIFTVTNPPGTVSVSTFIDGRVRQVELSQTVTAMTEADLAEEVVVIARLATQDARAAQYAYVLEGMRQRGHDDVSTRDFLTKDLDLPSPEEASAARAQTFTTRYAGEHD